MHLKKDVISSVFLMLFAGMLVIASTNESLGSFSNPELGLIPLLFSSLLGVLSLINIIVAWKKGGKKEEPIFRFSEMNWKNLIITLGALFAFPFSLNFLGFSVTVFGFLLILAKTITPRKWSTAISFALITTIVSYMLFVRWLKLVFEKGLFGI